MFTGPGILSPGGIMLPNGLLCDNFNLCPASCGNNLVVAAFVLGRRDKRACGLLSNGSNCSNLLLGNSRFLGLLTTLPISFIATLSPASFNPFFVTAFTPPAKSNPPGKKSEISNAVWTAGLAKVPNPGLSESSCFELDNNPLLPPGVASLSNDFP